MIRLGYIIFYVENVKRMLELFERVFSLEIGMYIDEAGYGELKTGDVTLAFASTELGEKNLGHELSDPQTYPRQEIGIVTDDVDGIVSKAVENGCTLVAPAKEKPWGQTVAYVMVPGGILVEVCTEVKK
ncbi:MAG: VOC family protein [Simkaniaceae bacterium]|nr:VOC family protein [Simkaniaceae bacterium]